MKFIKNIDPSKIQDSGAVILLTGDGQTEIRVIESLCGKINGQRGSKYLFWLHPHALHQLHRITGLNSLEEVRILMEKYPVNRFLWLFDAEHFENRPHWLDKITQRLQQFGVTVAKAQSWHRSALLEVKLGDKEARLWIAVNGEERNIEEDIAKLIRILRKKHLDPDKVKHYLRNEENMDNLIADATNEELQQSFPSLFNVLKVVHSDC